jgi:hypothetical protein
MIRALAGGDITKTGAVAGTETWTAPSGLNTKACEYRELKAGINGYKNNINFDAHNCFERICSTDKITSVGEYKFCRVSGISYMEEMIWKFKTAKAYFCIGYRRRQSVPVWRRVYGTTAVHDLSV